MKKYLYTLARYGEKAREIYSRTDKQVFIPALQALITSAYLAAALFTLLVMMGLPRGLAMQTSIILASTWGMGHSLYGFERAANVLRKIEAMLEREARYIDQPAEVHLDGGRVIRRGKFPPRPVMLRLAALTIDEKMKPTARNWAQVFGGKNEANEWQRAFAKLGLLDQSGRGASYEWTTEGMDKLAQYYHHDT